MNYVYSTRASTYNGPEQNSPGQHRSTEHGPFFFELGVYGGGYENSRSMPAPITDRNKILQASIEALNMV
jgi:hypothetical protein